MLLLPPHAKEVKGREGIRRLPTVVEAALRGALALVTKEGALESLGSEFGRPGLATGARLTDCILM